MIQMTQPHRYVALLVALLAGSVAACRGTPPQPATASAVPPGSTTGVQHAAGVVAANPYAVEAGIEVLRAGGSAADAAVAIQAMLGLVEPQSSGLGGGGFLLYYDAATHRVIAYDGRETAPAGATPDMFLDENGRPLSYEDAVTSGRSTGAPGAIAMLGLVHQEHGRLPWSALFGAPVRAAEQGFVVPERLGRFAGSNRPQAALPDARALFSRPDGHPVQAGDTLRNPAYAETLRRIAAGGPRTLLESPFATQIADRVHEVPRPGTLTTDDLAGYQPRESEPLCRPYRVYVICVPPPPSSGVALLQMLGILEHTDIADRGPADPQAWYLFAEASRIMYADRDRYVADPAFVDVPVQGLLDHGYVADRARLIGAHAGPAPVAGNPPRRSAAFGLDATDEAAGTSHFVVVDAWGNIASMTTTVESIFGSGRAVDGFFLNNQLTDFSFRPDEGGRPVANAVAPGKRPRSSMSPVIVLDRGGRPYAALGSPGGSAILVYNAKALVGLLDWGLSLQQAFDLPNVMARGDRFLGETGKFSPALLTGLAHRGVELKGGFGEQSGLHGVVLHADGRLEGAADIRREGTFLEP